MRRQGVAWHGSKTWYQWGRRQMTLPHHYPYWRPGGRVHNCTLPNLLLTCFQEMEGMRKDFELHPAAWFPWTLHLHDPYAATPKDMLLPTCKVFHKKADLWEDLDFFEGFAFSPIPLFVWCNLLMICRRDTTSNCGEDTSLSCYCLIVEVCPSIMNKTLQIVSSSWCALSNYCSMAFLTRLI